MSTDFVVAIQGLEDAGGIANLPEASEKALVRALNEAARFGRAAAQREIQDQVRFPSGYLDPRNGRLVVGPPAKRGELETRIDARVRPTSLARFVIGAPKRGENVEVRVKGLANFGKRAFLIRLKAGNNDIETKSNLGLAIRLKAGETLRGKKNVVKMRNGLYLLYGPSTSQIFNTVRADISGDVALRAEREFLRQLDLDA